MDQLGFWAQHTTSKIVRMIGAAAYKAVKPDPAGKLLEGKHNDQLRESVISSAEPPTQPPMSAVAQLYCVAFVVSFTSPAVETRVSA